MERKFVSLTTNVHNRGNPPDALLNELIDWAREASDEIFIQNSVHDIYAEVVDELGPV